ncbi:hypothetical protein FRC96_03370 [Lujinxingia vulgaris]|uniref:Uncharacterized protein n=1 Tax=Lujinxingia vulgaris TaxID=2600176 RepID=A0A5C6XIG9_9DELT|nr:hypothetical protein [Lujinxingia vulgaris]TXD42718.1 hypothetical protein FRC96_03370 [Lujinxingia vulgaris]
MAQEGGYQEEQVVYDQFRPHVLFARESARYSWFHADEGSETAGGGGGGDRSARVSLYPAEDAVFLNDRFLFFEREICEGPPQG